MINRPILRYLLLVLLSFGCAFYYLYITSYYGLGVAPDSLSYMSMAKHIEAGRGVCVFMPNYQTESEPMAGFSPLYPLLLAFFLWAKLSLQVGTWIMNNLLLFLNYTLASFLIYRITRSLRFGLLSCLLLFFDPSLGQCHSWILSEGLLVLLINLSLLFLFKAFERQSRTNLLLAALITSLIPLTKYVGLGYAVSGALCVLLFWKGCFKKKFIWSFCFGSISSIPLGLWLIRNYVTDPIPNRPLAIKLFGSLYHLEAKTHLSYWQTLMNAYEVTRQWMTDFFPANVNPLLVLLPVLVAAFLLIRGIRCSLSGFPNKLRENTPYVTILLLSSLVYAAVLIATLKISSFNVKIPARYLISSFVDVLFVVLVLVHRGIGTLRLGAVSKKNAFGWGLIFLFSFAFTIACFASNMSILTKKTTEKGVDDSRGSRWGYVNTMTWLPVERKLKYNRT